jgi:hypothetical protein
LLASLWITFDIQDSGDASSVVFLSHAGWRQVQPVTCKQRKIGKKTVEIP